MRPDGGGRAAEPTPSVQNCVVGLWVLIARLDDPGDKLVEVLGQRHHVDDRFRRQAGYGCRADVVEGQHGHEPLQPFGLGVEPRRPAWIIQRNLDSRVVGTDRGQVLDRRLSPLCAIPSHRTPVSQDKAHHGPISDRVGIRDPEQWIVGWSS
jgi:hypothetical protein